MDESVAISDRELSVMLSMTLWDTMQLSYGEVCNMFLKNITTMVFNIFC